MSAIEHIVSARSSCRHTSAASGCCLKTQAEVIKCMSKLPFLPVTARKNLSNLTWFPTRINVLYFHCRRLALTTLESLSWTPFYCASDIPPTARATTPQQQASASPELLLCTSEVVQSSKNTLNDARIMLKLASSRCQQRAAVSFFRSCKPNSFGKISCDLFVQENNIIIADWLRF